MSVPNGGNNNTNGNNASVVQNVTGTVFYNDGKTPLVLNTPSISEVRLYNDSSMLLVANFSTDSNGTFISPNVSAGSYVLSAWYDGSQINHTDIIIPKGTSLLQNLTTSRISTNPF